MRWSILVLVAVGLVVIWLAALLVPSAARYWKIKRM